MMTIEGLKHDVLGSKDIVDLSCVLREVDKWRGQTSHYNFAILVEDVSILMLKKVLQLTGIQDTYEPDPSIMDCDHVDLYESVIHATCINSMHTLYYKIVNLIYMSAYVQQALVDGRIRVIH